MLLERIFGAITGASAAPLVEGQRNWLEWTHPEYKRLARKWIWAKAHYAGEVLDDDNVNTFLVRKLQAETEAAYLERCSLSDYTPHLSAVVDSLAGMLFAVESDANRFFGDEETPGLGNPEDETSPMHRMWHDCDGHGLGWTTFWKQLAIELILTRKAWIAIDPDEEGYPRLRLWPAPSVPNWLEQNNRLEMVLLHELGDTRRSLRDRPTVEKQWVEYGMDSWTRWHLGAQQTPEAMDTQPYVIALQDPRGKRALPVFEVTLPLQREVGWILARKANAIFNKESELDALLRTAHFPYLVIPGGDTFFQKVLNKLAEGLRALQSPPDATRDPSFIAPTTEGAKTQDERLRRKVEEFYVTAFREYGDAARQKTATETKQDIAAGVGAFLQLLKSAVDEAENAVLWRIAQYLFPKNPERWYINTVERSENFAPLDIAALVDRLKRRYFGDDKTPIQLGLTGAVNVAKQIAAYDGIQVNEEELQSAVAITQLSSLTTLFDRLPLPASVRARLSLRMLEALRIVAPPEEGSVMDQLEPLEAETLLEEMLTLAESQDEAKSRESQPLFSAPADRAPPEPGRTPKGLPGGDGAPPRGSPGKDLAGAGAVEA